MDLIQAIRNRDAKAVRQAIASDPKAARGARAIGEAGRAAFREALELLVAAGADLNASYRNYRPLHSLLQEDPHAAGGKPSLERLACLEWMLEHGADPEQLGAWPSARAIVVAGFAGVPEYVKILRKHGAKMDGFAGAAIGDRKLVEKALAARPGFARERDSGGLTALHCAAGSRMPRADRLGIATLLLDAGAEVNATVRSWAHDVDALYFAAGTKDRAVFDLLLERGADATAGLGCALWSGASELAESALEHGAEIDRAESNGKPLLNDLIRWGQIPQVMWLLQRGASCGVADANGWTAVHQAASRGNERLLRAVLDAGGDKAQRDRQGQAPRDLTRSEKLAAMLSTR
jgi:ankyrin repeat protein